MISTNPRGIIPISWLELENSLMFNSKITKRKVTSQKISKFKLPKITKKNKKQKYNKGKYKKVIIKGIKTRNRIKFRKKKLFKMLN